MDQQNTNNSSQNPTSGNLPTDNQPDVGMPAGVQSPGAVAANPPVNDEPIPTFVPPSPAPPDISSAASPTSVQPSGADLMPGVSIGQPAAPNLTDSSPFAAPPAPSQPATPPLENTMSSPASPTNPFEMPVNPADDPGVQPGFGGPANPVGASLPDTTTTPLASSANPMMPQAASSLSTSPAEAQVPPGNDTVASPPAWGGEAAAPQSDSLGQGSFSDAAGTQNTDDLFAKPNDLGNSSSFGQTTDSYNTVGQTGSTPSTVPPSEAPTGATNPMSNGNMPPQDPQSTVVAGADTSQVVSSGGGFPKWIIAVAGVVLLLVAAAAAYFVFGIGQNKLNSLGQTPIIPSPVPTQPPVQATPTVSPFGAGSFGEMMGSTASASISATPSPTASSSGQSAIDLLKARESTPTPTPKL
ncbi:MAG: hypothetical protein M1607_02175 [Patescibacteria group bacterium]|nr:hypothetical protein [Patescibacteria group bacterium]